MPTPEQRIVAIVRVTIGAMFIWVFFENLGKGAYTPAGYAGVINYYLSKGSAPEVWKSVMRLMASNAAVAGPMQAAAELAFGVLLVLGLFARPAALAAGLFLASLWVSEWGAAWIWELLVPMVAALALATGRPGRTWGLDSVLARRNPSSPLW